MLPLNFLVSDAGHIGLDTNPIIMPIQKFGKELHRTISGLPLLPCIGGAPSERLMMSWWAGEIYIWRMPKYDHSRRQDSQKSNEFNESQTRKIAARIMIQVGLFINSSAIQFADSYL